VVSTAFDSEPQVRRKYRGASKYLEQLRKGGASVAFGVDCRRLQETLPATALQGDVGADTKFTARFDRVVFNFPHSGQQRVHVNRALLRDFFESAAHVLSPRGEVVVTLKEQRPYTSWLLADQAAAAGFRLLRRTPFDPAWFPGYKHVTTEAGDAVDGVHGFDAAHSAFSYSFAMTVDTLARVADQSQVQVASQTIRATGDDQVDVGDSSGSDEHEGHAVALAEDRIVFEDTDGSELEEESLDSEDEGFVLAMRRKLPGGTEASDDAQVDRPAADVAAVSEQERHDAALDAALKRARANRATNSTTPHSAPPTVVEPTTSTVTTSEPRTNLAVDVAALCAPATLPKRKRTRARRTTNKADIATTMCYLGCTLTHNKFTQRRKRKGKHAILVLEMEQS
jgi:hypothetical protein